LSGERCLLRSRDLEVGFVDPDPDPFANGPDGDVDVGGAKRAGVSSPRGWRDRLVSGLVGRWRRVGDLVLGGAILN
jgi:hypothetical protein